MEEVEVTIHAKERMKERCGLGKKSAERLARIAHEKGLRHAQMTGDLKRWASGIYLSYHNANDMRLYGDYLFLFKRGRLLTVFRIPNKLKAEANRQNGKVGKHGREKIRIDEE